MPNLKLALRSLSKTPLVSTVAVLSLALGIGANAAIFSIFDKIVLRPLPVEEPERLVNLTAPGPKSGMQSSNTAGGSASLLSYPMLRDLQREQTPFEGIAGHRAFGANLAYEGNTLSGEGVLVTGSYFSLLGLEPALGRLLGPEDDTTPGGHPVVVLSHRYWRTRFDADPGVLNRTLSVNGKPMTVVGVAPRGFDGTTLGIQPQIFVPMTMHEALLPGWDFFDNRKAYWIYAFARLRDGITLAQAESAINQPYQAIIREVEAPLQTGLSEQTLERFRNKTLELEPGQLGQSSMREESEAPLLQLLAVTALVLLIACANVANLLLTKATDRSGEIAVRLSIGARRRHLVGQLLGESFLLAAAGGLLALVVARATLQLIASILPPDAETELLAIGPPTWLFLAILAAVTGLIGLVPAWHSIRTDLASVLKGSGAQSGRSRGASRLRTGMATAQIAFSMTLLITAGLFTRSLYNVSRVDLGIDVDHLATFGLSPELNGYAAEDSRALFERIEDELAAVPGAEMATASLVPLIANSNWGTNVSVQGFDADPDTDTHANYNVIGLSYFRTLGVPLLAGREFERTDTLGAPEVAIVNETFARKFGLGRDAIGKFMQTGSGEELDIEIVGLVRDAKYSSVKDEVPPLFFLPYRQDESIGAMNFYVRSSGEPDQLLPSVRATIARLDPNLPIENLKTMRLQVRENVVLDRMLSTLSAAFAILATVLAAVGLYGVIAYRVAQRTREIGLRIALGADGGSVRRMVLRQVAWMAIPGAALGIAAALGLGRAARSLLYELAGNDPATILLAIVLLGMIAFTAGLVPARRAAAIDPMRALREE